MTLDDVLSHPPKVLFRDQRAEYFEMGYLRLESLISGDWLERLREARIRLTELSRGLAESNDVFVLDKGHSAELSRAY